MTLLEKTRSLNALLQKAAGKSLSFREMAEGLRGTLTGGVFVVSRRGKILGAALPSHFQDWMLKPEGQEEYRFPNETNARLLRIEATAVDVDVQAQLAPVDVAFAGTHVTIVPIIGGRPIRDYSPCPRRRPFRRRSPHPRGVRFDDNRHGNLKGTCRGSRT